MTRHMIVESKNSQRPTKDWQHEINIFEAYSEYRSNFTDTFTQVSFITDADLGRFSIVERRIEL